MGDYAIQAKLESSKPASEVRRWLDSPAGIAGWWSDRVEGAAGAVGDVFRVSFPSTPVVFELEVTELSDQALEWSVDDSPPWWKGTTIRFGLTERDDGGTDLLFSHSGFSPDDPVIAVITPAWVRFLDNLVAVTHTGEPNPAVVN